MTPNTAIARRWLIAVAFQTSALYACSVTGVLSGPNLLKQADVIVRATASNYAKPPTDTGLITTGEPDSRIRFKPLEVLRGKLSADLILPGYLVDADDFNDRPAPYTFVRSNGRRGSCFANSYRQGAEFLLLLKRKPDGEYTANWAALSPVNEQLGGAADPWLLWVKQNLSPQP